MRLNNKKLRKICFCLMLLIGILIFYGVGLVSAISQHSRTEIMYVMNYSNGYLINDNSNLSLLDKKTIDFYCPSNDWNCNTGNKSLVPYFKPLILNIPYRVIVWYNYTAVEESGLRDVYACNLTGTPAGGCGYDTGVLSACGFNTSTPCELDATITPNETYPYIKVFGWSSIGNRETTFYYDNASVIYDMPDLYENSQTYNVSTSENKSEGFIINLTYDNSYYNGITADLIYNGTSYSGTKIGNGSNILFTRNIELEEEISGISYQKNNSFYWTIYLTNITGTYSFNSQTNNQYENITAKILNVTFSSATNITISSTGNGYNFVMNSSIYLNQSDLGIGEVIITYGGGQTYSYYNDGMTPITKYLYVLATVDLSQKVKVESGGMGLENALVTVYQQIDGSNQIIGSGLTDSNGETRVNLKTGITYTFIGSMDGYNSVTLSKYIPSGFTDTIRLVLTKLESSTGVNQFYTPCGNKISSNKECKFIANLYRNYSNITINYYNSIGTKYTKECLDNNYCETNGISITNLTAPWTGYLYIEGELWNYTLYINYENLEGRSIQIRFPFDILKQTGNEKYLYIFYVLSLIIGIAIASAINNKIPGTGYLAMILWFGIIAVNGLYIYWLIVIPIIVLQISKLYRQIIKQ